MSDKAANAVERVFALLKNAENQDYIGEPISQLAHALQCGEFAAQSGASDDEVIAALLHDIGHLCAAENAAKMGGFGIDSHHRIGGDFARELGFSECVGALIEGHVEAKRYLVAKHPKYLNELSDASKETLKRQGGPMSDEELQQFESHPQFKTMLKLRTWDDRAKLIEWPGPKPLPNLESYRAMMIKNISESFQRAGARWGIAAVAALAIVAHAGNAEAYRPFEGTAATVNNRGEFGLAMGTGETFDRAGNGFILAPFIQFSFGILPRTSFNLGVRDSIPVGPMGGRRRVPTVRSALALKYLFRDGTLQGKTGLSIGGEIDALLPDVNARNWAGGCGTFIVSNRWTWGTIHLNQTAGYTRLHNFDLQTAAILEGPIRWAVRPVGELYFEQEFERVTTTAALVGALWRVTPSFVIDLGLRGIRLDAQSINEGRVAYTTQYITEARIGFSWSTQMWEPAPKVTAAR